MEAPRKLSTIPCCTCGQPTEPNSRGQCADCIRQEVDLTAAIPRSVALERCSVCGAFHRNPQWVPMELESPELLALCLRKTKGVAGALPGGDATSSLKLVDASFVWTEPHSKRLKVKLTVSSEVMGTMVLQQQCVVEYVLRGGQCPACERAASKQTWRACVQLRQRAAKARVLHYLEQLILAGGVALSATDIKAVKGGIDFFFGTRQAAERLVAFVQQYAMTRSKSSKTLVTHNEKAGTANVRLTWAVEVAPVCKDDLVVLPKATASALGLPSPLAIIAKVGRSTQLVHPTSGAVAYLSETAYWKAPFEPLLARGAARKFEVLDCEPAEPRGRTSGAGAQQGGSGGGDVPTGRRFVLGDVQVVREGDYEQVLSLWTHLGRVLHAGDTALGYDLAASSLDEDLAAGLPPGAEMPDVVLVGKVHAERKHRKRKGTFTRNRKGSRTASNSAWDVTSELSVSESAAESETAADLDEMLDDLELRDDGGELREAGAELALLDLRPPLEAPEEDEQDGGDVRDADEVDGASGTRCSL